MKGKCDHRATSKKYPHSSPKTPRAHAPPQESSRDHRGAGSGQNARGSSGSTQDRTHRYSKKNIPTVPQKTPKLTHHHRSQAATTAAQAPAKTHAVAVGESKIGHTAIPKKISPRLPKNPKTHAPQEASRDHRGAGSGQNARGSSGRIQDRTHRYFQKYPHDSQKPQSSRTTIGVKPRPPRRRLRPKRTR